ncbi:hypothetical protein [Alkaliphilus transvaalensis]|uniref:hypothetical protein n=1 Tax=Alkaliphilus transvaalensis TaxID=114628 RepID=UPI00068509CB|nr:hypothetical protein [Alkaliphilus transvaalensis]
MNFKKTLIILSLLLMIIISGCTMTSEKNVSNLPTDADESNLVEETKWLKHQLSELESSYNLLVDMNRQQVKIINGIIEEDNRIESLMPIYTLDVDHYEKYVAYYVDTDGVDNVEDKLTLLGLQLSKYFFSELPILFKGIDLIEGEKIATFDLREFDVNIGEEDIRNYQGKSWKGNFFQGSAGGAITSVRLIDSLLQRYYPDEWIDGIIFLYNGETENHYSDHVSGLVGEIHYRKR